MPSSLHQSKRKENRSNEEIKLNAEETKENNNEEEPPFLKKRSRKRKLKKAESEFIDPIKEDIFSSSQDLNNSCDNNHIQPIMKCEISNDSEIEANKNSDELINNISSEEHDIIIKDENCDSNKPIIGDDADDQVYNVSSHSGFPDLCVESDNESNSKYKSKTENLLNFFDSHGFIDSP